MFDCVIVVLQVRVRGPIRVLESALVETAQLDQVHITGRAPGPLPRGSDITPDGAKSADTIHQIIAQDDISSQQIPDPGQPDAGPHGLQRGSARSRPSGPSIATMPSSGTIQPDWVKSIDPDALLGADRGKGGRKTSVDLADVTLSLWDYGGQEVFYALHHLFLTRYGVYIVVFNMKDMCSSAPRQSVDECLRFVRFWLSSIAVHGRARTGPTRDLPPVLLIGTHKDKV